MKSAFTLVPTHRTKQSGYWLAGFIVLFMSVFSVSGLQAQTITTDKPDYAPGEYVIISGTGWLPGETVSFHFDETPKPATCTQSHDYSSVADANGNIYNSQFLIRPSHIGVAFVLTATGSSGSVAQTTFTDANVRVRTNDGTAEITAVLNTNTTCTVDVSSTTTNISAGTNAAQNASVAATSLQSVRLTAPATNSLLQSFVNWTSPNGATFTSINANTICVIGTNSNGALLFQANYAAVQSQTITFSALASKTYGDPSFNLTATASSGLPITYISSNTSVATISGSTVTIVSAGSTIITASQAGDANYNAAASVSQTFTINKRLATWTTDASSKTYGEADPSPLTSGSGNFLAADGVSATYTRAAGETVAGNPYHITALLSATVAGALDNYTITNAGADFTINKRLATWTTDASSKTYGEADPSPLTSGSGDFLAADGVSATYTRAAGETVAGNPYHITASLSASVVGALDNYTITNAGADFTINKRLATWTTDASSKTYGEADPSPLTSGSGNFLAADGVSATYTRAAGETVAGNPYHITALLSATVAGALDNYTITNAGADFTINKRLATWTTDASSKTYGEADPS
ncbi:MAG: MBG domain-containing protein, partial [Bacteroidota bacterium]